MNESGEIQSTPVPGQVPGGNEAFVCPRCRGPLTAVGADQLHCEQDALDFHREDGIWCFLLPGRAEHFDQFVDEYELVRKLQGWGTGAADYYCALPYRDLSRRHNHIWHIRARSFETLMADVVQPLVEARGRPLSILDLGAGNCWLTYRLTTAGQQATAVDILTNELDGLGARHFYDLPFTAVQAEFESLPTADNQIDLVVFNGSLHYADAYEPVLREALRVLRPGGRIAIMDSPTYNDPESGAEMVREREAHLHKTFGFSGNALPNENYLTFARIEALSGALSLSWQMIRPDYGWRWGLRPLVAQIRRYREPATFMVLVGSPLEPGQT